jgi:hypothetical protein
MSKFTTIFTFLIAGIFTPAFYASSLQDWEFNINGTDYFPALPSGATLATVPGLTQTGFNATTGIGTYQIKVTTLGADYIGAFFYLPAGIPFYNEYGATNGSLVSGESWQIDVPEYDLTSKNHGGGTIIDNLANEALDEKNTVPGSVTNYLANCGANGGGSANAACDDAVGMALGFKFTPLTAGQTETVTFTVGTTNPGIFSLEDIHPVDGANTSALDVYLSGTAVLGNPPPPPPPPGAPEPASAGLAAAAAGVLVFAKMRHSRRGVSK